MCLTNDSTLTTYSKCSGLEKGINAIMSKKRTLQAPELTNVSYNEAKQVKFYLINGKSYATASNWRMMNKEPLATAFGTILTTKNGYEIKLFSEDVTTAYDASAYEAKKKHDAYVKKESMELFKLYQRHEIGLEKYTTELAELNKSANSIRIIKKVTQ